MRALIPVRPPLRAFYKKALMLHFNAKVVRVINDNVSEDPKKHTHECAQIRSLRNTKVIRNHYTLQITL